MLPTYRPNLRAAWSRPSRRSRWTSQERRARTCEALVEAIDNSEHFAYSPSCLEKEEFSEVRGSKLLL
jgi:hypothetical protein